ncbi:hypothetical protein C8R44DRAFT_817657 [Mycena epipterygia]|nr:hypothetical protein C8R44DRAFT_817657 [Mycena epipterygia]
MPSIVAAALIQAFVELTLYGIYFVVFSTVLYLFWHKLDFTKSSIIFVLLAIVLQFLAITAHWINTIYGTYLAFVHLGGGLGAEQFYGTLGTPTLKTHIILSELINTITDSLVIHRLYVIWDRKNSVVAFPLVLLATQIVSGIGTVAGFFTKNLANLRSSSLGWVPTSLATSLGISAYSTGMISWKILRLNRTIRQLSIASASRKGNRLDRVLVILVESAALQTAMNIALLLSFFLAIALSVIFKGTQAVVLGLSTVLIHARIGLGWTQDTSPATATNSTAVSFTVNVARSRGAEETELGAYPRK